MPDTKPQFIRLRGVRQNNLKSIDLDLPLGKLIVVTGLSGAGKSSLVFETLHAEGQRRYVETFSAYTRQFLEMMDKPDVDSIENIRPSIAIEQGNTVKTSRSTVGTMTELCDFFKVWFCHSATLHDPATGKPLVEGNAESIRRQIETEFKQQEVVVAFQVTRPAKLKWETILKSLSGNGYSRVINNGAMQRIEDFSEKLGKEDTQLQVIQDRVKVEKNSARLIDAICTALQFGHGECFIHPLGNNRKLAGDNQRYLTGLRSPKTGETYRAAQPALFSFNSPIGACPKCRGFGRVIEIDYRLVVPDATLSLKDGAIKCFQGEVYSNCQRDMERACRSANIPLDIPYRELPEEQQEYIIEGEPDYVEGQWETRWYGVRRFFEWLEGNTYKMHVRVFLSRFRSYTQCPDCKGARLQAEALNWKWQGHTLPDLYNMPVSELYELMLTANNHDRLTGQSITNQHQCELAYQAIVTRLGYLQEVGLGYLTLYRTSRTLSGGEVERVNLTSCLGTSLVDTLFVLDEPSVGLHARDIDRLVQILRKLADQGNTVVVVEHDEAIMRAADHLIEVGPEPGAKGGRITFSGTHEELFHAEGSITGDYLNKRESIPLPAKRRAVNLPKRVTKKTQANELILRGIHKHNVDGADIRIPLQRLVCLSGVSGSGKSTLLNNAIYQGILAKRGRAVDDAASIKTITGDDLVSEVVLVDQSPVSKTPRSNPALYADVWDHIRNLFAATEASVQAGHTASSFSFNSGSGRCPDCQGLGYERVEMQFMADVFVPCAGCEGKRFIPEVLAIQWNGKSVADVLKLTVAEALEFFATQPRVLSSLQHLIDVGLGYLPLGQPLNTLSGGESQRLKLVKYLSRFGEGADHALLLLDEPTTGLHRHDVKRLIGVMQQLVNTGHSLVVIEHHMDVLKSADWLIEIGPEAGSKGGKIIFTGTPDQLLKKNTQTSPFLLEAFAENKGNNGQQAYALAAEDQPVYGKHDHVLRVLGAREHNLKNISVDVRHGDFTVVTGVSGSGKSTLAFDIIFAEGQRRFMESMSPYARQFVEQLPRPELDELSGIAPTVAIEQRVTRGTRKSTVATITEVAQYLRLLYSRLGVQHSPQSGNALIALTQSQLEKRFLDHMQSAKPGRNKALFLCAPIVRGRKGHYQPLATWASEHGYELMRTNGSYVEVANFKKLDRYREHDVDIVVASISLEKNKQPSRKQLRKLFADALKLGKGACFLDTPGNSKEVWFSTRRYDPDTGEFFPELDPKHFSWNSPKGWCESCRGYSVVLDTEENDALDDGLEPGQTCPDCEGTRLNTVSRAVHLHLQRGKTISLPEILSLTPSQLMDTLSNLKLDTRGQAIAKDIVSEIGERLKFMDQVGLEYLSLNRATATLSGGEAQRIRLAAQLGTNLSGVLYVLDEPSIGLHARDNERLIQSLHTLRAKGNTLVVVEHDDDTMRAADCIIDLGPEAGIHGGEILANGSLKEVLSNPRSLTARYLREGIPHPINGSYRKLTAKPKSKKSKDWLTLEKPDLRNLRGNDLHLPLGRLTMVCGISGAGKSTLVRAVLKPAVEHAIKSRKATLTGSTNDGFAKLINGNAFRQVIEVDQNPIGKTPRSTPATYIGAFDIIRDYYASLPEAQVRGLSASTFSFNTMGGRCETCKGAGRIKMEMNFLPDTYVDCDDCDGRRFGKDLEDIRWHDKSIGDVLAMSFEEAAEFFDFHHKLGGMMRLMVETGLGYLRLGQSSPTLSGGEAQRVKLVSELARGLGGERERIKNPRMNTNNLYILEEPTIGLHLSDCEKLIHLLHRLVEQGHTVVVIEHHLDLIAEADYVVELGPEGGEKGGRILYQGKISGLLKSKLSPTANFLKDKVSTAKH